jgi:hypothetical protein
VWLPPRAKRAIGAGWPSRATLDEGLIRARWSDGAGDPCGNVGVVPRGRQAVLDVDVRHGGAGELARLEAQHGPLPATLTVLTGSDDGSTHRYFTSAEPITGVRGIVEDALVLRGGGRSLCVAPPSVHPLTGARYCFLDPDAQIAPLPAWLEQAAAARTPPSTIRLERVAGEVRVRDEQLLGLIADPGPHGDRSAGDYRCAKCALELGYTPSEVAALIVQRLELHGGRKTETRERRTYLERTLGAAAAHVRPLA